ncbi:MAG: lipopolysaccharide biosynthesis protein [Burkholderiales bacterium]|nr:lipopolysaccharide biosynthesis protein [Burkholderiales bacterium]
MASATSASFWAIAGGMGTRGVSFLIFVFIARLLSPNDMGVMAIALVFGMFLDAINELGLSEQVVRYPEGTKQQFLSTVFWLQSGMSILTALAVMIGSPWVARLYGEPLLTQALGGVCTASVFTACSLVSMSLLQRRMAFQTIAIRNTVATIIGGIVGLSLAYSGFGVMSLVAMHMVNALTGAVVTIWSSRWKPSWCCQPIALRAVAKIAGHSLGARLIETATLRVDQLLIGSFFGASVLGLYALAFRFYDVIFQAICAPINSVLFPFLAQKTHAPEELRQRYLLAIRSIAVFSPPVFLLAALFLPALLGLWFGPKWVPATPFIQIILGAGAILALTFSHTTVFSSLGKPQVNFGVLILSSLLWLSSLFFLPALGPIFAPILWALRMAIGIPIQLYFLNKFIGLRLRDYLIQVKPALASSGAIVVIAFGLRWQHWVDGTTTVSLTIAACLCSMIAALTALLSSAALRNQLRKVAGRLDLL